MLGCPFSGSLAVTNAGGTFNSVAYFQCLPLAQSTTYNFGARIRTNGLGFGFCHITLYSGVNCSGTSPPDFAGQFLSNGTDWSPATPMAFSSGAFSSGLLVCYVDPGASGAFDMLYVTPAPGGF